MNPTTIFAFEINWCKHESGWDIESLHSKYEDALLASRIYRSWARKRLRRDIIVLGRSVVTTSRVYDNIRIQEWPVDIGPLLLDNGLN